MPILNRGLLVGILSLRTADSAIGSFPSTTTLTSPPLLCLSMPIESLPHEILDLIFQAVVQQSGEDSAHFGKCPRFEPRRKMAIHSVSLVCTKWSSVVHSSGGLWRLDLSSWDQPGDTPDTSREIISSWKGALLNSRNRDIYVDMRITRPTENSDTASAHIRNCITLLVDRSHKLAGISIAAWPDLIMLALPLLNKLSPLPRLGYINLITFACSVDDGGVLVVDRLDLTHAPVLTELHSIGLNNYDLVVPLPQLRVMRMEIFVPDSQLGWDAFTYLWSAIMA